MIRTALKLLPGIALGVLLLCACSEPAREVAGGSAVEGETVSARLLDAQGRPVARTRIHAVVDSPSDWSLDISTDDSGRIALQVPTTARILILTLESPDLPGRILSFRIALRPSLDTSIVLERWGSLSGTAQAPSGWTPRDVLVPGLGLRSTVANGKFHLPHIPPGDWPLLLVADSAMVSDAFDLGEAHMPAGGTDIQQTFSVRSNSIFSAPFDDTAASSLPACPDVAPKDSSCAEHATGSSAWSGASLRLHIAGSEAAASSIRLSVGVDSTSPLAAKAIDTLALMARGTGLVGIVLGIASGDSTIASAPFEILLNPTWTRHRTTLSKLLPTGHDLVGLQWIEVISNEDSWIVLDDLGILTAAK